MRRSLILTLAALLALGVVAGGVLAQGPGNNQGQGHGPPPFDAAEVTVISSDDHGDASGSFVSAAVVDSLELGEGSWKITATGAASLDGDSVAFNCGLRIADDGSATGFTMLGKVNPAEGGEEGRVGFAVVGALDVDSGSEVVDLVCYGGGNLPFEHNLVAIGGS